MYYSAQIFPAVIITKFAPVASYVDASTSVYPPPPHRVLKCDVIIFPFEHFFHSSCDIHSCCIKNVGKISTLLTLMKVKIQKFEVYTVPY